MTHSPRRASYVIHVVSVADQHDRALKLVRQLDETLDLLETEPRFQHLTLDGQTLPLEDYLSIRPEHFERIEQAVQDGRLLIGPWTVQPGSSLASAELTIRNLMIGLRTARVFGRPMTVAYLPETPGLPGHLPQILLSFGIDTVIARGEFPVESTWQGSDGSQVTLSGIHGFAPETPIPEIRKQTAPDNLSGHLLIVNPWTPDTPLAARLEFLHSLPAIQAHLHDSVFHSTPAAYARAIQAKRREFPTICGDLGTLAPLDDAAAEIVKFITQRLEPLLAYVELLPPREGERQLRRPQILLQKLWREVLRRIAEGRSDWEPVTDLIGLLMIGAEHETPDGFDASSLVTASDPSFVISAVKLPDESQRQGFIVRGQNTGDEPVWVTLTVWRPFAGVEPMTMDESPTGGQLAPESNGAVIFRAAPHRILTFWFHD